MAKAKRDSRGRFQKGGSSGGSTSMVKRSGGSVVVVRQSAPEKKAKKGGRRRKGGGGRSFLSTGTPGKYHAKEFVGGALWGKLKRQAVADKSAILNKVPVVKSIGERATHGVILTFATDWVPAGIWRDIVDGAASALLGSAGINFGLGDFKVEEMAKLGDAQDIPIVDADGVRERYAVEGDD